MQNEQAINSQEMSNQRSEITQDTIATQTASAKDTPIIKPRNSNTQITPSQSSIRLKIIKTTLLIGFIANVIGAIIAFASVKFNLYNPLTFYKSLNLELQVLTWCIYLAFWIALLKIVKSISKQYN